jgi:hypothetical protein
MEKKVACAFCEGSGIRTVPNGPHDFDKDYCFCEIGAALEKSEEVKNDGI